MIKNIKVDSLKLPIKEGALKKSLLSEDFPLIGWILGIWILVRGKLLRILFVSIMKHFDGALGTVQIWKWTDNLKKFLLSVRLHGFNSVSTDDTS